MPGRSQIRFFAVGLFACALVASAGCDADPSSDDFRPSGEEMSENSGLNPTLAVIFNMIQDDQVDQARLRLQRYNLEHPDDGHALFLFGLTFHVQSRYSQARGHFESALALLPEYPPVHYFLGWCLYQLGELDAARERFETHLDFEPAEADSHYALGLIALDQGRLDDAIAALSRAILLLQDEPGRRRDFSRALSSLGEAHMRGNDFMEARQHLERATEVYPDDHEALYQLYRVLLRLGEEDDAAHVRQLYDQARERADLPSPPRP